MNVPLGDAPHANDHKNGYADAYERMKAISRGKRVTWEALRAFVEKLEIKKEDRVRLLEMLSV